MAAEGFKRKLAAILSADVAGYSRLMEDNEEATVRTLKPCPSAKNILFIQHATNICKSKKMAKLQKTIPLSMEDHIYAKRTFVQRTAKMDQRYRKAVHSTYCDQSGITRKHSEILQSI